MPGNRQFATDYIDVAERIVEFREKYPDGSLQPADITRPFQVVQLGQETYIAVVAAAYRTPEDPRPGVGMAYEVFPGRTPYTKGSELQNAETSAWGRAIVAALAADTKRGIASAQEVRNREAERDADAERRSVPAGPPAERSKARKGAPAEQQPAAQEDPWKVIPLTTPGVQALDEALSTSSLDEWREQRRKVFADRDVAKQTVLPSDLDELADGAARLLEVAGGLTLIVVMDRVGGWLKAHSTVERPVSLLDAATGGSGPGSVPVGDTTTSGEGQDL